MSLILDSSVYIPFLRSGAWEAVYETRAAGGTLYLSAVVARELRTGAVRRRDARRLDRLWRTFERLRRLITPSAADWYAAGEVLSALGQQAGWEAVKLARTRNDVLIALSARRAGAAVVTANVRDFLAIQRLVRVTVVSVDRLISRSDQG